jgi:hypothetical protein
LPLDTDWLGFNQTEDEGGQCPFNGQLHTNLLASIHIQAWRKFAPKLDFVAPRNDAEVLSTPLWWTTQFYGSSFGFTLVRATNLARQGLRFIQDMWNSATQSFMTGKELSLKFHLGPGDLASYDRMVVAFLAK